MPEERKFDQENRRLSSTGEMMQRTYLVLCVREWVDVRRA